MMNYWKDNKPCILLACGGHGRVLLDTALMTELSIYGILDPNLQIGDLVFDVPVLGGDDVLESIDPTKYLLINGVGSPPENDLRYRLYSKYTEKKFNFCSIIHKNVIRGRKSFFADSVQILAGAVIQCGVSIGVNTVVNTSSSIDHDCKIGNHVFVAPGSTICGDVIVEDFVFIGAGATILPGITIGKNAIIGAGALVNKNVPANTKVMGIPAKKLFT